MVRAVPDGAVWLVYPLCGVPAGYITPGQMSSLPLCATAIVFSRMLDGKEYTFGVSGKLWHNGLVMYDHQTDTLWSGIPGEALVGSLAGKQLDILAAQPKVRWQHWVQQYPDSQVLTYDGVQDLDADQYAAYHLSDMTGVVPVGNRDHWLPPKALVMGVRLGDQTRAYPLRLFEQEKLYTALGRERPPGIPRPGVRSQRRVRAAGRGAGAGVRPGRHLDHRQGHYHRQRLEHRHRRGDGRAIEG